MPFLIDHHPLERCHLGEYRVRHALEIRVKPLEEVLKEERHEAACREREKGRVVDMR